MILSSVLIALAPCRPSVVSLAFHHRLAGVCSPVEGDDHSRSRLVRGLRNEPRPMPPRCATHLRDAITCRTISN